ncbi:hypothetical protein [Tenacibaculum maritimum]|uniref:hypothetical protein n=1 Tax=Tenacibaculum maritimum TaxID=107401 RepID=UPI0012E527D2|nr:hypothetical protein [Tenacibaculum maritimum]MCD9563056.1 hypothetical protein [Tenacibaculum maritimum]MCD9567183.1 hypothetical protein [Tenacibaculum maritimum]MCD9577939.1 hypothetical protein [Tenacibaculum maritimum]MCD9596852.1 hypothetical protein [Tenacibaculum maritimum]MCD9614224.1 hypothetical protein [Tenacibaculum maritimum]
MKKFNLLLALAIAAQVFTSCENNEVLSEEKPTNLESVGIERSTETVNLDLTQSEQEIYTLMSSLLKEGKGFSLAIENTKISFTELMTPFFNFNGIQKESYLLGTIDKKSSFQVIKNENNLKILIRIITEDNNEKFYTFHLNSSANTPASLKLKLVEKKGTSLVPSCTVTSPDTNNVSRGRNRQDDIDYYEALYPKNEFGRIMGKPDSKKNWKLIIYKSGEGINLDSSILFAGYAFAELYAFKSLNVEYKDGSSFHESTKDAYMHDSDSTTIRFKKYLKSINKSEHITPNGEIHFFARKQTFNNGILGSARSDAKNARYGVISTSDSGTLAHEVGHTLGASHYDVATTDGSFSYYSVMKSTASLWVTYRFYGIRNRGEMIRTIQREEAF